MLGTNFVPKEMRFYRVPPEVLFASRKINTSGKRRKIREPLATKVTTPRVTTPRVTTPRVITTAAGETLGEVEKRANEDLKNVRNWLSANNLNLNIAKTEYVLIGSRYRINSLDVPTINQY